MSGLLLDHRVVECEYTPMAETRDQAMSRVIGEGEDRLRELAPLLEAAGFHVDVDVVVDDHAAQAIVEYARRHHVDMIAMSTHGAGGLRDMLVGSVTADVTRSGVAPVVVIRPAA
jgi:nucleotide-binding universal stress UspA family protein